MMSEPGRTTFGRWTLGATALLAWTCLREVFLLAGKLGLSPLASKTWLALLGALALTGGVCLALLVLSFTTAHAVRERWLDRIEIFAKIPQRLRLLGYILLAVSLVLYPLFTLHPYFSLLASLIWMRLLVFWLVALAGALALKLALPRTPRLVALLVPILFQAVIQRVISYLPDISQYPFAMGWSETTRFYYPALFMGRAIFGQALSWPILHPSLHLLLVPPYLLHAPLWFHRFWQVALRFLLVGLIAPALIHRLGIPESKSWRWLTGLWIFVVMFTLPLYLHLAVPVILVLWGFSATNDRRTWFWLALASIWAGLSRLNWYPVPGMLVAALYFLEVPSNKKGWPYLIKPALWFVALPWLAAFLGLVGGTWTGWTRPLAERDRPDTNFQPQRVQHAP